MPKLLRIDWRTVLALCLCASLHAASLAEHWVRAQDTFIWGSGYRSSMGEHIRDGDVIRVLPKPMEDVRRHHVIEVKPNGYPGLNYIHEVIAVRRAANGGIYFITQGTANMEPDPLRVTEAEYRGTLDLSPTTRKP